MSVKWCKCPIIPFVLVTFLSLCIQMYGITNDMLSTHALAEPEMTVKKSWVSNCCEIRINYIVSILFLTIFLYFLFLLAFSLLSLISSTSLLVHVYSWPFCSLTWMFYVCFAGAVALVCFIVGWVFLCVCVCVFVWNRRGDDWKAGLKIILDMCMFKHKLLNQLLITCI